MGYQLGPSWLVEEKLRLKECFARDPRAGCGPCVQCVVTCSVVLVWPWAFCGPRVFLGVVIGRRDSRLRLSSSANAMDLSGTSAGCPPMPHQELLARAGRSRFLHY